MKEIWKDIPTHEGLYQASSCGNIRSLDRLVFNSGNGVEQKTKGKILKLCLAKNGYVVVNLGRKTHYVHRLVCEAFLGAIPQNMTVNHKDGNKKNNHINNLEVVTRHRNPFFALNMIIIQSYLRNFVGT